MFRASRGRNALRKDADGATGGDYPAETQRRRETQKVGVLTFDHALAGAVRVLTILEEAAELGIRASMIGHPTQIPQAMATFAQQRAAEFAERGSLHAHKTINSWDPQ